MKSTRKKIVKPTVAKTQVEPPPAALVKVKPEIQFSIHRPQDIADFSLILKNFILKNKLSCVIQGKNYVYVDGWKFAGLSFGLSAIPSKPLRVDPGKRITILYKNFPRRNNPQQFDLKPYFVSTQENLIQDEMAKKTFLKEFTTDFYNYTCDCEIINLGTGIKVGYGFALCNNSELKKVDFDEYALASMAQTRAIAKAYRNLLGFIMNEAGFESTPAEEMEEEKYHDKKSDEAQHLDIMIAVNDCKTEADLRLLWEKNISLQKNTDFKAAVMKRKVALQNPPGPPQPPNPAQSSYNTQANQ